MNILVKIILVVTRLYYFIQSYKTIRNIYNKVQLDLEYLLIHLFQGEKEVVDQTIYISTNTNTGDRVWIN